MTADHPTSPFDDDAPSRDGAVLLDSAPVQIGPFRLLRRLGTGHGGRVFVAADSRGGALVALKVVPGIDDDARGEAARLRERLLAELDAARRLDHPDIVKVLDAGAAGSLGWIAMELVPGCDLTRYTLSDRLLPERVIARLGARLARALAHAHAHGIVHRDVKPANVLVDWSRDVVKLVDFGVARWREQALTRSGQALGSPEYMAPEQLAGAEVGPAADIYSLGVTLFELLCGRRPFSAPTLGALLRAVARDPAPDLQALRPMLPAPLCRAVMAALAKQPARRIGDAAALAEALELAARA